MSFTQIIEVRGVTDEKALRDHIAGWDAEQAGVAPGYRGARVLAEPTAAGQYLVEVDFSSEEEAKGNNEREETAAWARKLRELADGEPTYRNPREVATTYR